MKHRSLLSKGAAGIGTFGSLLAGHELPEAALPQPQAGSSSSPQPSGQFRQIKDYIRA